MVLDPALAYIRQMNRDEADSLARHLFKCWFLHTFVTLGFVTEGLVYYQSYL